MASPSVSTLNSYSAPGAKGSLVVGPGGFTATDGCTLKTSIDLQGPLAWGTHKDRSCPSGHPRGETQNWDRRHGVTSISSLLFRRLAPDLADVISQAVFHITRLVKSPLH